MTHRRLLVLGTRNQKKAAELIGLLSCWGLELKSLADFPNALDVVEDGNSFAENAAKKAAQQAQHLQCWVLGEDSGLVVDALNGSPGIFSARFAGPGASDEENNLHLLAQLGDLPLPKRTAHYVCHAAVSDPDGEIRATSEARCHGLIRTQGVGTHGFGYDPLFEIREYHQTFGQLGPAVKTCLSHRARAVARLAPRLASLLAESA